MKSFFQISVFTAALAGAALAAIPASAQHYFRTTGSGQSVRVDAYMGWRDDCSHQSIDIDVVNPPRHGTLTPRFETETIRNASIGSAQSCKGRKIRAMALYYRSKKGYRGQDQFRVRISVGGQPATYSYTVNVR